MMAYDRHVLYDHSKQTSYNSYSTTLNFLAPASRQNAYSEYSLMFTGISQWDPSEEQLFSFMWHLSEIERSGPYGEPQMGPHPPQAEIAQSSWFFLMGNTRPSLSEKRKEVPVGSLTYSFSLVLSHLAGVYPPNTLPLSDLAIMRVGPRPTQCSLKRALWKLYWLALKRSLAETSRLLICENMMPTFLISSLEKTGDISLKMLPMLSQAVDVVLQNQMQSFITALFLSRKVAPEGQRDAKVRMGLSEVMALSSSQMQLSLIPPTSCPITLNSLILLNISSFCSRRDSSLLALTRSLNTNLKSSLGQLCAYLMKLR